MKPEDVDLLRQALPYINRFKGTTFVVKIGGNVAENEKGLHSFCEEVALCSQVGIRVVMIHGGGKQASDLSEKLGIEPKIDHRIVTPTASQTPTSAIHPVGRVTCMSRSSCSGLDSRSSAAWRKMDGRVIPCLLRMRPMD